MAELSDELLGKIVGVNVVCWTVNDMLKALRRMDKDEFVDILGSLINEVCKHDTETRCSIVAGLAEKSGFGKIYHHNAVADLRNQIAQLKASVADLQAKAETHQMFDRIMSKEATRYVWGDSIIGVPLSQIWEAAPVWANWLTMDDSDGYLWFWENKPQWIVDVWQGNGRVYATRIVPDGENLIWERP